MISTYQLTHACGGIHDSVHLKLMHCFLPILHNSLPWFWSFSPLENDVFEVWVKVKSVQLLLLVVLVNTNISYFLVLAEFVETRDFYYIDIAIVWLVVLATNRLGKTHSLLVVVLHMPGVSLLRVWSLFAIPKLINNFIPLCVELCLSASWSIFKVRVRFIVRIVSLHARLLAPFFEVNKFLWINTG